MKSWTLHLPSPPTTHLPLFPLGAKLALRKLVGVLDVYFHLFIISGFVPKDTLISWEWIFPKFCIENILFGLCLSVSN